MATIVSAFVTNINSRSDRNMEKYIEYGKQLLQIKTPKVIFIDELVFHRFQDCSNENTHLISIKKEDNYLYEYKSLITDYALHTTYPEKDTIEYMFTMCHKTEWIKKAILLNLFKTEQFIWVDFGISHMMCNELTNDGFTNAIIHLTTQKYEKIRIASIWQMKDNLDINIYKTITWFFAGSIFGGKAEVLMFFADLMKNKCIEIMKVKRTLMWEINIWFLIYNLKPSIFDCYLCNHNSSILLKY